MLSGKTLCEVPISARGVIANAARMMALDGAKDTKSSETFTALKRVFGLTDAECEI
jgi:hypothetical protein